MTMSPWPKFTTVVARNTAVIASANSAYSAPCASPLNSSCPSMEGRRYSAFFPQAEKTAISPLSS